jgi:putative ABC transport system permease protein
MKLFIIAFRNLITHKNRTLILSSAIAFVTLLMSLMMSLTEGIRSAMIDNASALSTGHVNVGGFYKVSQSSAAPVLNKSSKIREVVNKTVPEATAIVERVRAYGKIISDQNTMMFPMTGINMVEEKNILGGLQLAQKSSYIENFVAKENESSYEGNILDLSQPGSLVLFSAAAKKLKVRVGDILTISMPTYRNQYNTRDVKLVAVLQDLGLISGFTLFLHHKDASEIYDYADDTTGVIQIYLPKLSAVPEVEDRLRKALSAAGYAMLDREANPFWMKFDRVSGESWTGQRLDVTSWRDETAFLKWIIDIFNGLTYVLTLVLMSIVVIGLVNNLWMAIRERTSEIGTMRAIGLQRRGVLLMFLYESLILSVLSVGLGLVLSVAFAKTINALKIPIESEAFVMFFMSNTLSLKILGSNLIFIFGLLCGLLMFGSLFPARRASKLEPIAAINQIQ